MLISNEEIVLGKSMGGRTVALMHDFLERHLLILGKTGTGKSNILRQIINEIVEKDGGSVVIFDPHGSLAKAIVSHFPDRSLVLSPVTSNSGSGKVSFSLNAIGTDAGREQASLAAGWIKDTFSSEDVLSRGTWGPRLEVVFSSILQELMSKKDDATLSDLLTLLLDQGEMRRFISSTENQQLKAFLKMQVSDWRGWNQYVSSSVNKLLPLLTQEGTKNLIAGKSDSLNLVEFLRGASRVIVPEIWKSVLPEDSYRIVAILILLKIWLQSMQSQGTPGRPIYLVFDEAQVMPGSVLDRLLREGRKFGLRAIMATQFLDQDQDGLLETVKGNVSNVISFSLAERDAWQISSNFFFGNVLQKTADTLKSQTIHRAVVWSQNQGGISGPLSFTPVVHNIPADDEVFSMVREETLKRYGIRAEEESQPKETDLHEFLITEFEKYLQKKGIETDRNRSYNGIYPDLVFSYNDSRYFVEVEVSDLVNFPRIGSKITNYAGKLLVFLCPPGTSKILFTKIVSYLADNDTRIHDRIPRRTMDILERVSIIEFSEGFKFFAGGRLRTLRMEHLARGSFLSTIRELRFAEVRDRIYSMMLSRGQYRIDFPEEQISRIFGIDNCRAAKEYLVGNSAFITIYDLFMEMGDDTKAQ